jgi:AcrR family transcriptional regulator
MSTRRRGALRFNEAGHETRERILDTAERLFADRGIDAVSVREITEASATNNAAVHYHFGSKQDLVAAILGRRADQMSRRRDTLLDELERTETLDLRAVVEATVLPTAEMAADGPGGHHYVAFIAALGSHPEYMPLLIAAYTGHTERYLATLARAVPDLPDDVRLLRFAVARDLVNRVIGQPKGQIHQWIEQQSPGADDDIVARLVDMVIGIFAAPDGP